ncbi:MAG: helix-turn-helix domain-containing protein [Phaeodactylibacter xiamenensis]|uniref:Helix-turn-helix domain-containing protein n=1 Tax=Phaeodactylibacter xiamenensis TaxID=1524460 RepID=A0A098S2A9_9BACT|nr:helix-turn-helix domain-containing protein [Phaeodactylibacter xiamenensis]KGE85297.1 hypothetical protein IX84_27665 [Phaeodactylibacter xiamenensis]MCR9055184.1 helix-turn-helix domain-containing protein [bacterium]
MSEATLKTTTVPVVNLLVLTESEYKAALEDAARKGAALAIEQAQAKAAPEAREKFHTRKEAAQFMGVSIATVDKLRREEYLKPSYIKGSVRYKESDLLRILEEGTE